MTAVVGSVNFLVITNPKTMQKPSRPKVIKDPKKAPRGAKKVEAFDSAVEELFFIENPGLKKGMPETPAKLSAYLTSHKVKPVWLYYTWNNTLVKTVPENIYFKLRTSRNRNIILDEEQQKYRSCKVGIAGLSVGSGILSNLVVSGGPKDLKIADFDVLEITNLNRIRGTLLDVGDNKAWIAARQVWELDPYAKLEIWDKGISNKNIEKFILKPKLDVFVDSMDSLDLKIRARYICRQNRIPVLMGTDLGDGFMVDVERYDLDPATPIFNGLIPELKPEDLEKMDYRAWLQLATQIVGTDNLPESMLRSLVEIGRTIPSVPQLGPAALMTGAAVSFAVRRISCGQDLPSGRYAGGLESALIPHYNETSNQQALAEKREKFKQAFGKPR